MKISLGLHRLVRGLELCQAVPDLRRINERRGQQLVCVGCESISLNGLARVQPRQQRTAMLISGGHV